MHALQVAPDGVVCGAGGVADCDVGHGGGLLWLDH
jgi:hypothetical protein